MRNSLWAAFLALVLTFALCRMQAHLTADREPPRPAAAVEPEKAAPASPPAMSAPETLRVLHKGEVTEMELEDYLVGVVAAEMPADFEPETLKAQAVAARSFALYCRDSGRHADADVCTDPGCCQAWKSEEDMHNGWGADYDRCHGRVAEAVSETAGAVLTWEGRPIFAAFHSSSAGMTEDCAAIWGGAPYLLSVSSPESAESVPGYVSTVTLTALDFRDTLLSVAPEADFSGEAESWVSALDYDASGRAAQAVIGGAAFTGAELRALFSLRSTAFSLDYADGVFTFTVTGFGHGVGMSQFGANVMAAEGADFADILVHYYQGTELTM